MLRQSFLFALFFCCLAVLAAGQPLLNRAGLCVSSFYSQPPLLPPCDIISNGTVNSQFASLSILSSYGNDDWPQFWISIDPALSGNLPSSQQVVIQYINLTPGNGELKPEFQTANVTTNQTNAIQFSSQLICNGNLTNSPLTANFSIRVDPGIGSGFAPMIFFFSKTCQYPIINIGTYRSDSDVYQNSIIQPSFQNFRQVLAVQFFYFYLSFNQTLRTSPISFTVTSSDPTTLNVTTIPGASTVAWDLNHDPQAFVGLHHNCLPGLAAPIDVQVTGSLNINFAQPLTFTYFKTCGVTANLPANVGTKNGTWDIALNGTFLAPWNSSQQYRPDQIYNFNLFFTFPTPLPQPAPQWTVTIIPERKDIYNVISPNAPLTPVLIADTVTVYSVSAQIICAAPGTDSTLIQLEVDPFDPLEFEFKYTCVSPLFNMGAGPDDSGIIRLGIPNPDWHPVVSADVTSDNFFVFLDRSSITSWAPYSISIVNYNSNILQPTVSDPQNGNMTFSHADLKPVVVTYNCSADSPNNPITLQFNYMWRSSIHITYYKDCKAPSNSTPDNGGGSGWSAAGIFFFTVFIISLFFCFSGCAWNKFHEHKTGLDIIPGGATARSCYERAVSKRSVGPQSYDRYGNFDNDGVNPSYQSNL